MLLIVFTVDQSFTCIVLLHTALGHCIRRFRRFQYLKFLNTEQLASFDEHCAFFWQPAMFIYM